MLSLLWPLLWNIPLCAERQGLAAITPEIGLPEKQENDGFEAMATL
jgi:hypothetical protein